MNLSTKNIVRVHQTWFARLQVPADCQARLGKKVLKRTTGTHDPAEAIVLARPILADFKAQIAHARSGNWRQPVGEEHRTRAQLAQERRQAPVRRLTPFVAHLEPWGAELTRVGFKVRQRYQYEADVKLYGADKLLSAATLEATQAWVRVRHECGDSNKTLARRLAALRNYWAFLEECGILKAECGTGSAAPPNPFKAIKLPREAKDRGVRREALSAAQIADLWSAARSQCGKKAPDQPLADLIALAAFTGARIEELCSATVSSVLMGPEGLPVALKVASKSKAGDRTIPLHAAIQPLVRRLMSAALEGRWLIHAKVDNNKGERSSAIGKRFGLLKTRLGHGPSLVFHSLRKTVATMLHDAGCPEPIAADILGHEIRSMSYGVYSTGSNLETRRGWLERAISIPGIEPG